MRKIEKVAFVSINTDMPGAEDNAQKLVTHLERGYEIETVASSGQGTVQYVLVRREEEEEEPSWKN